MTLSEFLKASREIQEEQFVNPPVHPFKFGIEKSKFEQAKLKKLIHLAEKTDGKVVQRYLTRWRKEFEVQRQVQIRFERLLKENP